jgi:hypothetical protein
MQEKGGYMSAVPQFSMVKSGPPSQTIYSGDGIHMVEVGAIDANKIQQVILASRLRNYLPLEVA